MGIVGPVGTGGELILADEVDTVVALRVDRCYRRQLELLKLLDKIQDAR
jgi:DNA invertase Pin-like site-specific DNA recombinase